MQELQAIFEFLNDHDRKYWAIKYLKKHFYSYRQVNIIISILDATDKINIKYLCKLPMTKLYKVAKQYKVKIGE